MKLSFWKQYKHNARSAFFGLPRGWLNGEFWRNWLKLIVETSVYTWYVLIIVAAFVTYPLSALVVALYLTNSQRRTVKRVLREREEYAASKSLYRKD